MHRSTRGVSANSNNSSKAGFWVLQAMVLDLLEHKSVFSPGYKCVLHLHAAVEECQVDRIVAALDPKTKEQKKVSSGTPTNGKLQTVRNGLLPVVGSHQELAVLHGGG